MLIIDASNAAEFGCTVDENGEVKVPTQSIGDTTTVEECRGTKEGLLLKGSFDRINNDKTIGRYRALGKVDQVIPYEIVADLLLRKIMYDVKADDEFEGDVVPANFRTFVKTERTGGGAKALEGEELEKAKLVAEQYGFALPEKCTKARFQGLLGKAVLASMK